MIEIKKADDLFKSEHSIKNDAYVCSDKDEILGILEYEMKDKDLSSVGISIEVNKDEKYFINRDNYSKLAEVVSIILGNGNNIKESKT